jgi:ATP-dependent 26S proteasome regulatory subunit
MWHVSGKTTAARIIAAQTDTSLVYIPVEAIVSKWYGEGEQKLAHLLEECAR